MKAWTHPVTVHGVHKPHMAPLHSPLQTLFAFTHTDPHCSLQLYMNSTILDMAPRATCFSGVSSRHKQLICRLYTRAFLFPLLLDSVMNKPQLTAGSPVDGTVSFLLSFITQHRSDRPSVSP